MADDTSISAFFSGWELFQYAALSSTALGAVLGAMGVYIVVRRMVFFSAALSQVAALGVAMSFWLGAPALLFATLFTGAAVTPAAMRPSRRGVRSDSMLGLIFLFGAAGTLAVGTKIVQDLHEIDTLLLGSAVAVLPRDAYWVAAVSLLLALLHGWWWRAFVGVSMDSAGARVRAMPVSLLDLTLFASLAVGVALSTTVIGALPTFAFSVLPGIAATRVASNLARALLWAAFFGALTGFGGYLLAFMAQLPVGASQALLGIAIVCLAELVRLAR